MMCSRRRVLGSLLALLALGVFATTALAATNVWAGGYPKTGVNQGTILIKGAATPDAGWGLTGEGQAVIWPVGGGVVTTRPVAVNAVTGAWGEDQIGFLTSGVNHNVVVQAKQVGPGMQTNWIATDTKQVVAK